MKQELQKISAFLEEAQKVWEVNPELVLSRQFFELWETNFRPRPFMVDQAAVSLAGQIFSLPGAGACLAFLTWSEDEKCPVLTLENTDGQKQIAVTFEDGYPLFDEHPEQSFDSDELSLGERIEVMYDVIAEARREFPDKQVMSLTAKEYQFILERLQHLHDAKVLRLMRRLSQNFVKRLLKRAATDMAADELSNQLFLPLDGSYNAVRIHHGGDTERADAVTAVAGELSVSGRTTWRILQDLEFIEAAAEIARDHEQQYSFSLKEAEILSQEDNTLVFRMASEPDVPLREGELLLLYCDRTMVGKLLVDLFDGDFIYGRLRGDDLSFLQQQLHRLQARSRDAVTAIIANALRLWTEEFKAQEDLQMGALSAVLGVETFTYRDHRRSCDSTHFDAVQGRAIKNATDSANIATVIQGPPGTGKTAVMEEVVRQLLQPGARLLITAPSNAAVDNICQRLLDLALLRVGAHAEVIAADIRDTCWSGRSKNRDLFSARAADQKITIFAGTHVGLIKAFEVQQDIRQNGIFDVVIFDEAGMTRMDEFLLCAGFGRRVVLFGDHKQLPPLPLPEKVDAELAARFGAIPRSQWMLTRRSALEWLVEERKIPLVQLQHSYRCQNPRLMRFASTFFYDANVKTSSKAEYYQLSYAERNRRYPASSLLVFDTGQLPTDQKNERLTLHGGKPGLDNLAEAELCAKLVDELADRYPLSEIAVVTPYRAQVVLLRQILQQRCRTERRRDQAEWQRFLQDRISTVDSFQGRESDVVLLSYVRSNARKQIGFIADPNRVNVACTRCRRELVIVADLDCLTSASEMFARLARAVRRDGEICIVTPDYLQHGLSMPEQMPTNSLSSAARTSLPETQEKASRAEEIAAKAPIQQQFKFDF